MTSSIVSSCVLLALLSCSLAALQLSQRPPPRATNAIAPVVAGGKRETKASAANQSPGQIPFPPRFEGWLAFYFGWAGAQAPKQPNWYPLDPPVQKWVDDVLAEWELVESEIDRLDCEFQRWEFEPIFGPRDGKSPKSYATGVIKYAKPDKAIFHVEKLREYVAAVQPTGKPQFVTPQNEFGEHWVCDGKSFYEFDYRRKKLIERRLPSEIQGKSIENGQMPFLLLRSAAAIKQRYWIRPVAPPEGVSGDYWLELWPKNAADAAACKFIHVVIAESDFQLEALSVAASNYDVEHHRARVDYRFNNRTVTLKGSVNPWRFLEVDPFLPKTPPGWKKEVYDLASANTARN